jgi:hypothetical protein
MIGEEGRWGWLGYQKLKLLRRVRRVTEAMSAARPSGLRCSSLRQTEGQNIKGSMPAWRCAKHHKGERSQFMSRAPVQHKSSPEL